MIANNKRFISIHAPHTGRDDIAQRWERGTINFNPRAPYGARQIGYIMVYDLEIFQSTRPIRGATAYSRAMDGGQDISIHAPHTGRDQTISST